MIKECTITIWANHFNWRMRNNHLLPYPSTGALAGHCELVDVYEPKEVPPCFSSVNLHPKSTVMANLLLPLGMHKTRTQQMHCDKAIQRTHTQFERERQRHTHTRRNPRVKERGKDGCSGVAALLLMCLRCVRQDYNSNSLGCGNSIIIIIIIIFFFFFGCCLQEAESAILAMWWCGEIVTARESGGGGRSKMACRDGEEDEEEKGDDDGVGATRSRSGSRNGPR